MSLFSFLFGKKKEIPETTLPEEEKSEESQQKNDNVIKITWGTGMPIDVIYAEISKNWEEEGYNDAMVDSDRSYMESKETILQNRLSLLFDRIILKYNDLISDIELHIDLADQACLKTSALAMRNRKKVYESHIQEIKKMKTDLGNESGVMKNMISSYKRGFDKGIAKQVGMFMKKSNIQNSEEDQ